MNYKINVAEKVIKDQLYKNPVKDLFPITICKYLMNRETILNFFNEVKNNDNLEDLQSYIDSDHTKCNGCVNNSKNMLCRKHTSIERIMNTKSISIDTDNDVYFFMNEIFKFVGNNKLAIVYCPHTKLIYGTLSDYKIKKISMISTYKPQPFGDKKLNISEFKSDDLMEMSIKCWFNDELSLITIPNEKEQNFYLVPNK